MQKKLLISKQKKVFYTKLPIIYFDERKNKLYCIGRKLSVEIKAINS